MEDDLLVQASVSLMSKVNKLFFFELNKTRKTAQDNNKLYTIIMR